MTWKGHLQNMQKMNKLIEPCPNCGYKIKLNLNVIKEQSFNDITATYIECPVCGEKILKQLDNKESSELATIGVKLEVIRRDGHIKSKQAKKLKSIEKKLYKIRKSLNQNEWNNIYQLLNN